MGSFGTKLKNAFLPPKDVVKTEERDQWGGRFEFVLSLIGCSVGLGNLWKFPSLAYQNGGGAFLIPYFIIYFIVGWPMYFLEISVAQFVSRGAAKCFSAAPFWKGVGYATVFLSLCLSIFYSTVVAWVVRYLFGSFTKELVWNKCNNEWNTDNCIERDTILGNWTYSIKSNKSIIYCSKDFYIADCVNGVVPTEEYLEINVYRSSSSIENFGTPAWDLALCSLLTWIIVALCIIFGIRSVGKVVYVTALLPYIILIILLVRSVTLEGSLDGIKYYVQPNFEKLKDITVWYRAGDQVFFSLGISGGTIMMYSSYNKFNNNFLRDSVIVTIVDCFTSFFSGFAVFGIIGFVALKTKTPIDKSVKGGPGLAFITYPEAAANMPVGPLWAILFFVMLFTLGIDSLFSLMEHAITAVTDLFPNLLRYKSILVIVGCSIMYLTTLPLICPGGMYVFESISSLTTSQSFLIIGLLEITTFMYIYGVNNIFMDIKMMLKKRPLEPYFFLTWSFGAPLLILLILILSYLSFKLPEVNGEPIPNSIAALGWALLGLTLLPIPLGMIHEIYKAIKNKTVPYEEDTPFYYRLLKHVNSPNSEWRPSKIENCTGRYAKYAIMANAEVDKDSFVNMSQL